MDDLRQAIRTLLRTPMITFIALLTLALGIGANSAIFSLLNTIILRPLPFAGSDRLILGQISALKVTPSPVPWSAPDLIDLAQQSDTASVSAFLTESYDLTGPVSPQRVRAARVTANLFPMLAVPPALGRVFTSEEDEKSAQLAVISHSLWLRLFGGDHAVLGRSVSLSRKPYTIIGVMPKSFLFPIRGMPYSDPADVWVPMSFTNEERTTRGDNFNYFPLLQLKPGVSLAQAVDDTTRILAGSREKYPPGFPKDIVELPVLVPVAEQISGGVRGFLFIAMGVVALVLLIACANIATLLLAKSNSRAKEMAVRVALGATRFRLARQLIIESITLSVFGGVLGVVLSSWVTDLLVRLYPDTLPRLDEISFDWRIAAFSLAISILAGLIFGSAPALSSSRTNSSESLKQIGRTSTLSRKGSRAESTLVTLEVAACTVLLIAAGLLLRTLLHLQNSDPGFRPDSVLSFQLSLPNAQYPNKDAEQNFYRQLHEDLAKLPGVVSVASGTSLPMINNWGRQLVKEGQTRITEGPSQLILYNAVMGDYLKTLGIPLKAGRFFSLQDRNPANAVIVVNETFAKRHFPQGAIGKRIKIGAPESKEPWLTIVGVVGDVRHQGLDHEEKATIYEPYIQQTARLGGMAFAVRTAQDPDSIANAITALIRSKDPSQVVADMKPMNVFLSETLAQRRFQAVLITAFASLALILAAVGLFGVISHSISARTRELGIRIALGANASFIWRLVLVHGLKMVITGIVIGLLAALALQKAIAGFLYGVRPTDLFTFIAVPIVLLAVTAIAIWRPAQRALSTDPLTALRCE